MSDVEPRRRSRRCVEAVPVVLVAAVLGLSALATAPSSALPDVTVPTLPPPLGGGTDGGPPLPEPPITTTTTAPPPSATTTTATVGEQPRTSGDIETTTGGAGPRSSSRRSSGRRSTPTSAVPSVTYVGSTTPASDDRPVVVRLRQASLPAARQFGFPLGLAALVLGFLAVQGRLDARDPKLAIAPLSVDDDLLPFT